MALTILLICLFGAAFIVPAVWSVLGLIRGDAGFWPGVAGACFAILLMLVTLVGATTKWGDAKNSDGAIVCRAGNAESESDCKPDPWRPEKGQSSGCAPAPAHAWSGGQVPGQAYCAASTAPVFTFCEHFHKGGIKQPWATWSDLSFLVAGVWLLWFLHFFGSSSRMNLGAGVDNPMTEIGVLSVAYGFIVIFMGPPSMWYHASMKEWAGWFDSMSVVAWLMFNSIYVIYALIAAMWGHGRGIARTAWVLGIWGAVILVFGAIATAPSARLYLYLISGGLWGVAEVVYLFVAWKADGVQFRRTAWLFLLNFLLLGVTMLIWVFFNDGIVSPMACQGREDFPGHALFHILASFSTILTFASLASERRVSG